MTSQRVRASGQQRINKNAREREKRRRDRLVQSTHDYGCLFGAKVYLITQDSRGEVTEYQNSTQWPPSRKQLQHYFPMAERLGPKDFRASTQNPTGTAAPGPLIQIPPPGTGSEPCQTETFFPGNSLNPEDQQGQTARADLQHEMNAPYTLDFSPDTGFLDALFENGIDKGQSL
ncbi:hypothetical protein ASPWEDRAFT_177878 [Aspergillus wentii DTO 134E9]|uniref:MADS-box domain-containing protein n=1 Tax=Aspergillus wentii DTO 134E9 TaxID=1073089 RepID=A0A1L9R3W5_ASPWE|nr:uncharacterized protein ASPWEDRAFT_177878 [Aspergillus wentii DTO 134E9]OJJ29572.1 hypothetical protein ASPWEDRAFT_177878 [Aspergillus wentii DTO 134E9]